MELSKKTTILFTPDQHRRLSELAVRRGTSLGDLVREACVVTYGMADTDSRLAAVQALGGLALPVGTPAELKRESVVDPAALLP
jgi:hypothetical protein